jgi:hypothetical protein
MRIYQGVDALIDDVVDILTIGKLDRGRNLAQEGVSILD